MKRTLLLLTAGIIVGVGASQFLRAAEGPPVYSVAEINVRDKAAYEKALPEAMNFIKEGGGKYLAGGFDKATTRMGMPLPIVTSSRFIRTRLLWIRPGKAALARGRKEQARRRLPRHRGGGRRAKVNLHLTPESAGNLDPGHIGRAVVGVPSNQRERATFVMSSQL